MKTYRVNEIFYSLQGEGVRAGTANLFLRFTGCNLTCKQETHGFDCDTEFTSGRDLTLDEILKDLEVARRGHANDQFSSEANRVRIADHSQNRESNIRVSEISGDAWNGDAFREASQVRSAGPTAATVFDGDESAYAHCDWIILTGGEPALQIDRALIDGLHKAGYKLAIETNGSIALPDGIDWITVSPKVAEHAIRQRTADEVKYVRGYGQGIPKTVVKATHKLISPAFDGGDLSKRTLEWCVKLVRENPEWRLSIQMHKAWKVR